ncbi:HEAT repeat domain-containing protein [Actinophytocola algeriensis]|uniref:HEAT repeat domain-containing protein n=1 Tax=Actinophytocola algeriensis TaxID=1768010 RepID=UPI0028935691|nr:HEAT repeat domain-containing protein [Actinophytocola algeriensis]
MLLGDPGSGKSTLARYLALALSGGVALPDELEPLRGLVPLVVELRVYTSPAWGTGDFLDLVAHLHDTEAFGLPRAKAGALLAQGRVLVVFDGLDEVFDPELRETTARRIIGFAAKYPQARMVVTSRIVGYQRTTLDNAGFAHHKLEDLDRTQVARFVDRWYATVLADNAPEAARMGTRLLSAVDTTRAVAELAGNPLLLTILAIIGRRRELPQDRRAVYQHAVTVLVQHWDISKHLAEIRIDDGLSTIVEEDKLELLRRVARRMQDSPSGLAGNHIPGDELTEEFERFLRVELELPAHRARPVAEAMLDQFRHRNFILSRFGAGVYGFVHRAFLEYLAADDIIRRFTHERSLDEDDLVGIYAAHWQDPAWHEVLRHITGLLNENFARLVIEHLLTLNPNWRHTATALPHHIVLAVQCLSERRRLGPLASLSRTVAQAVTELLVVASTRRRRFESKLTELIEQSVLPAMSMFGPSWAGREVFHAWYVADHRVLVQQAGEQEPVVLNLATRIAVQLAGDDLEFRETLREQMRAGSRTVRVAAIAGLAASQLGEEDAALLRELVDDDADDRVRAAAVRALGLVVAADLDARAWLADITPRRQGSELLDAVVAVQAANWPDHEETLPWLRAVFAEHDQSRPAVLGALSTSWSGNADVLDWLRAQALESHTVYVRNRVIAAIGTGWGQHEGVREWLTELAERGGSGVREEAMNAIATRWRHAPEVLEWLRRRVDVEADPWVRSVAVRQLCEIWTGDEAETQLRTWARDDPSANIRDIAINAVAARTSGPELRVWLREIATGDPAGHVRSAAIQCLMAAGEDAGWVERHALADPDTSVRNAAVRAIAEHSAKHDLLDWLQKVAVNDPSGYVRGTAVELISDGWPRRGSTLAWLRDRVAKGYLDAELVKAIATGWPHEPDVLAWLQDLVSGQASYFVRAEAVGLIAKAGDQDVATVDWLRSLAETDVEDFVRSEAIRAVNRLEPDTTAQLAWLLHILATDWYPPIQATAVQLIAENWSHSVAVRDWVLDLLGTWRGTEPWNVHYVIHAVWLADPDVRGRLRDIATHDRSAWLRGIILVQLVDGWQDLPDTVVWLRERATDDPDPAVRCEALEALQEAPQDDDLTAWLRDVATNDPSASVRARALSSTAGTPGDLQREFAANSDFQAQEALLNALLDRWELHEGVRDWVREVAMSADDDQMRGVAVIQYARKWPTWPGLLDWLWEWTTDRSAIVRRNAIFAIAETWTHVSGVVDRLKAIDDPDVTVRLTVIWTADWWPSGGGSWLRERAGQDEDPAVRAAAIREAAEIDTNDPGLLDWLHESFATEQDWHPRSALVEAIAYTGARSAGTVEWLRSVATGDDHTLVRSLAVEWALGWAHDPTVRSELSALGAEDTRAETRLAAVRALGGVRPADPVITEWLQERTHDSDEHVSAAATRLLADRMIVPELVVH